MMDTKPNINHSHTHTHNHNHNPHSHHQHQHPHQQSYGNPTPNPLHSGESNYPLLSHHYTPTTGYGNGNGNYGNYGMNYDPLAPLSSTGGNGGGGTGQSGISMNMSERNGESSRRRTPPPTQNQARPGPTPYPHTLTNPALSQFEFPSANSTPNGTPSGSEVDHDHEQDGDGENENEDGSGSGVQKSGRAGNRRRQKYSRTRTGCLSCRTRRIKCDEARPVCKRCIIAKKTCLWPTAEEDTSKKKKERNKRTRSSEADGSGTDEDRKSKRVNGTGNDLGLYNYNQYGTQPTDLSTFAQQASSNGLPTIPDIPAGDFTWDQSQVGSYDPSAAATFMSLMNGGNATSGGGGGGGGSGTSTPAGEDVGVSSDILGGMMGEKKWGAQGGAPMFNTPNFLLPWFPTAEERSLILHYCANAADLMMAIPSGLNPMLAINLPLALDSPRGVNPSADALRVALLGIGAVHQAFLLARSGSSTTQTATMFQYASNLRDSGKEMVRRAAADGTGAGSDAALGASTALATIDIFFGGSGWGDNFKLAKEMIAYRGGPAEMLKVSKPRQLAEGVTMSPARLMLEILAIYETFGCLTTGQEPSLISDKWESWWFEGGRSSYEEHSVEKQFGMSRVMVHLFSRLTRLISRVSRFSSPIPESGSPPAPSSEHDNNKIGREPTREVIFEARSLKDDVDAWIESLQLATLEHERVQVGNRAYAYAMKILLLRMVFGYTRDDAKVQDAALQVLTHCSTSTALLGMSIDLTWPAIIAGCCVDGTERRQWLMTLLEGFKAQCCFDIETATTIIVEVWRRVDGGEGRADWKPVCEDLGLQVLLC